MPAPAAVAGKPSVAELLPLAALCDATDAPARDRRARARTESLLADLAGVQAALLRGKADSALLDRLRALAEQPNEAAHPELAALADWVALRAQVLLARIAQG